MLQAIPQRPTHELLEFDAVDAIERLLDDVADVAGHEYATTTLSAVREMLHAAVSMDSEPKWRDVYARLLAVAKNAEANTTPAAQRLRSFLAENDDLATPRP